ncbi:MAG: hypothetical protein R8G34_02835 [Paracoccaceae bacterium]|nr:hypothetical protein [Paracoccaceae bacterium]
MIELTFYGTKSPFAACAPMTALSALHKRCMFCCVAARVAETVIAKQFWKSHPSRSFAASMAIATRHGRSKADLFSDAPRIFKLDA